MAETSGSFSFIITATIAGTDSFYVKRARLAETSRLARVLVQPPGPMKGDPLHKGW